MAAPIAIVGFTYWPALRWIDLGPYVEPDKISFFRLSVVSRGDAGRSIYPSETMYIAASATSRVVPDWDRSKTVPGTSTLALESNLETGPSVYRCSLSEVCVAPTRCLGPRSAPLVQCGPLMSDRPGWVGFLVNYPLPILIAAIDPPSEAALAGVDHCVVEGRYLRADDAPGIVRSASTTLPASRGSLHRPAAWTPTTSPRCARRVATFSCPQDRWLHIRTARPWS